MRSSLSLLAAFVASAVSKTISIDVGKTGLVFSPDSSTAAVGDVLEFHFYSSFHTVVQSSFDKPCALSGFNSGPVTGKSDGSGDVFQVKVTDTNPIWFYCSTPSHCQSGMAGVINPPASGNTLDAYKTAAAATDESGSSTTVSGGELVPAGSDNSGSSSGAGSSSSSAASPKATGSASSTPAGSSGTEAATPAATPTTKPSGSSASSAPATASSSGSAELMVIASRTTLIAFVVGLAAMVFLMA